MAKRKLGKGKGKGKNKRVKGTLSKKARKALKRDLDKVFEVKSIEKAKSECNHRSKKGDVNTMSIADLRAQQLEAFVPNLQSYIDTFGEENVEICKGCYTPIVKELDLIDVQEVNRGLVMLEAMATAVVINCEKEKEIGTFREVMKSTQKTGRFISKRYIKVVGSTEPRSSQKSAAKSLGGSKEV